MMQKSVKTGMILLLSLWLLPQVSGQPVGIQSKAIRGRIIDKQSHRPLAFVNITYLASGQGTVSNIDGAFSISSGQYIDFLLFSYVGYHSKYIPKQENTKTSA